jgi:trimethylamine---corrinoid protein Co-methyltransferase
MGELHDSAADVILDSSQRFSYNENRMAEVHDYKGYHGGQYTPLSQDKIGRIHETATRVLEEVGIRVDSEEAREVLLSNGAKHDEDSWRVKLSAKMIERSIRSAPSRVVLYGRKEQHDIVAEGNRTYFGTGGAAINIIDLDSGITRSTLLQDIADFARLVETMPNIHFFVRPCTAQDVPPPEMAVNEIYASLVNTSKHILGSAYTPDGVEDLMTLGSLVAGSREALIEKPFFSIIVGWMDSPLAFNSAGTDTLLAAVRSGIPVMLSSAPMAGSTAPVTLAGTLVQLHAEELAGIVLTQLAKPGAPVLYGGIPSMADLHHLTFVGGGVESGMMNAAIAQLSHYINIPNYNSAGITEAKIPDIQAVYEKCFAILQCALSGSNIIHHAAGILESLLTISHEQLIIDNEIISMAIRAVRGIEVNEDTLAYDVIKEYGATGNYLFSDHTVEFMRSEFVLPTLADRNLRQTWEELGMEDIREKARKKAKQILAESSWESEVPPEVDKEVRKRFSIYLK